MVNLGALLRKQGKEDQAMQWYRRAADAGDADAMHNLGALLGEQGEEDQAEQWYRKAADARRRDG
jgi:TPR repeat protein